MVAEVMHGIVRTVWLAPQVGDFRARQIAVVSGSLLILLIASLTIRWMRIRNGSALLTIGGLWVALTLAFEIALGRWVLDYSWEHLASDYDLRHGGLLPIGLLVMAMSPWLAARMRGRSLSGACTSASSASRGG